MSLLYGDNPSYALSAAVLGHSLRRAKTRSVGWTLRLVKHIKFQKELYPTGRFPHVFTKLHAVGMEKYDKVIVLDTDVLIRNDMDEPFERQTPAAVRRHPQGKYLDFAEIDCRDRLRHPAKTFAGWKCSWQQGDISAGQVLLRASGSTWTMMRKMSTWYTFLGSSNRRELIHWLPSRVECLCAWDRHSQSMQ